MENIVGQIKVDKSFIAAEDTFALKLRGDSMKEEGLLDGDVIFAKPQPDYVSGDIVVVLIGEDALVRKYIPQGNRICFEPANRYYAPVVVERNTPGCRILGRAIGMMRKLKDAN